MTITPPDGDVAVGSVDATRPPSGRPLDLTPGQRLLTITGGDRWMDAEAFVYETYVAIGFTRPNARRHVEELSRWAEGSRFHLVVDDDDRIIGTIRTIFGEYASLPVASFERTDLSDPDPVCELSSLVVDPTARSTGVVEHLFRAGWSDAWRHGARSVVAIIDDWLFDAFRQTYRLPFRSIGDPKPYMGGEPLPVSMPLEARAYGRLAVENPEFWTWTLEGVSAAEFLAWDLPLPGGGRLPTARLEPAQPVTA